MRLIILFLLIFYLSTGSFAQKIGLETNDPKALLDINGEMILRSDTLVVMDGITYDLDVNTSKFNQYKVLGPTGNFTIAGIRSAEHDRIVTLFNRSGHSLEINNEDLISTDSMRILTGTGGTFIVYSGGSVTLKYDNEINRWEIISSHYNNLDFFGSSSSFWSTNGNDISNVNVGNVGINTYSPSSRLSVDGELALLSDTIIPPCGSYFPLKIIDNQVKRKSIIHIVPGPSCSPIPPSISAITGGNDGEIIHIVIHIDYTSIHHLGSPYGGAPPPPATAQDSLNMIEFYDPNTTIANNVNFLQFRAGSAITLIYDGVRKRWKPLSYHGDIKPNLGVWYKTLGTDYIYSNAEGVGIGTNIPSRAKFVVNGVAGNGTTSAIFGGESSGISLQRNWPAIGFNQYRDAPGGWGRAMSSGYGMQTYFNPNNGSYFMDMQDSVGANIAYTTPPKRAMSIFKNGFVHIGANHITSNATLSISGSSNFPSHFNFGSDGHTYIRGGSRSWWGTNRPSKVYINDVPGFNIFSGTQTPGGDVILALGGGNVGIGTENLPHKLCVNGTIRSKEILVEAGPWPDYVFDPQYKLLSLDEIEQHIAEKKHLPNIPSAKDIQLNGQTVGEIQRLMLEKIEELTLHIIALNKKIEKLENAKK